MRDKTSCGRGARAGGPFHSVLSVAKGKVAAAAVAVFASVPAIAATTDAADAVVRDLRGASWVCPAAVRAATNTTFEFRIPFDAAQAGQGRLALAADTVYSVLLNGRAVCETGRFPDVPPLRWYDVLALDGVRKGANELVVRLYVQGVDSFQHIPGDPGLAFALDAPGVRLASGATSGIRWRRLDACRSEGVPRVTFQLGFSFEYDAAKTGGEWRAVAAEDCARPASAFDLRRRPVAPSEVLPAIPTRVVAQGALAADGVADDVAGGMDAAKIASLPFSELFPGATDAALPSEEGLRVAERFLKDGFSVTVDLGREEVGLLDLELETDAGTVVDVGHGEHAEDGRVRTRIGDRSFAGRYRARDGRQAFCHWARRMAGRYVQLQVRGAKTRFVLHRVSVKPVLMPMTEREPPQGLTAREREIFRTSARTLRLSMHEHYEDCPWREQALYANDARNQILAGACAFADAGPFAALSLELLGRGVRDDGWIDLCMPARIPRAIPSFTFAWTLAVCDHWTIYRDRATAERLYPVIAAILAKRVGEMKDGLLPCPRGARYWHFYDWEEGLSGHDQAKDGEFWFDSPLNLLFALALEAGEKMASDLGHGETSEEWKQARGRLVAAVRARFWDGARGEFRLYAGDDVANAPACELSQALALLAGAVPEGKADALVAKLAGPSEWTKASLSQSFYKYEALVRAGGAAAEKARASIDAIWGAMLDAGATSFWEVEEGWRAFDGAGSLCHGWSAIPAYFYGRPQMRERASE